MDILTRLRQTSAEERPAILSGLYEKNKAFFAKKHQGILDFLERTQCPYHFQLTEDFLDIIDDRTGECAHPQGQLDGLGEMLGDWLHDGWIDLIDFEILGNEKYPIHYQIIETFHSRLTDLLPAYFERFQQGRVNLKELPGVPDQRFSPPVIFLGIFHGLHIARYLARTSLVNCLLIEPEPERFEVSCYFLDYEEIEKRFGRLTLSIGPDYTSDALKNFFNFDRITPQMWTRVLPGYAGQQMAHFVEAIKSQQRAGTRIFYPVDFELQGIENTVENLRRGGIFLSKRPKLSKAARIAIVATGPSLNEDIAWLKRNQEKLVIFAVHSSVALLRQHGIVPDFQFSIETKAECEATRGTLYPQVPLVAYCRADTSWSEAVDILLLVSEQSKAQAVQFLVPLRHTHPSTTNLAFSFACFCLPRTIYLIGCDFGFKDQNQHHADGSLWKSREEQDRSVSRYTKGNASTLVQANFSDSGYVQTQPFLNQARIAIEEMVADSHGLTEVVNVSDGVRVQGTRPLPTQKIKLKRYGEKKNDCQLIKAAFQAAEEGVNYQAFSMNGCQLLNKYLQNIIAALQLKEFSLLAFAKVLDEVLDKRLGYFSYSSVDWRMDVYSRLLNDLLRTWYRVLLFCENQDEAQRVYAGGMEIFQELVRQLEWPEELGST